MIYYIEFLVYSLIQNGYKNEKYYFTILEINKNKQTDTIIQSFNLERFILWHNSCAFIITS